MKFQAVISIALNKFIVQVSCTECYIELNTVTEHNMFNIIQNVILNSIKDLSGSICRRLATDWFLHPKKPSE